MKLVMTLLVRDEADVIDAHLAFHLHAGADLVIAMDHRSHDGTTEILRAYEREGYVVVIPQDAERVHQSEWVTTMARLAASEHGADWVINSDADEFWWPCASSLKEALDTVPSRYGVVYATMCYFLPRPSVGGPFSESMTVRLLQPTPMNSPRVAIARQSRQCIVVPPTFVCGAGITRSSERAHGSGVASSEVLHSPIARLISLPASTPTRSIHGRQAAEHLCIRFRCHASAERDAEQAFYERAITDDALSEALAAGTVVIDSRLRDALRRLRSPAGEYRRRSGHERDGGLPSPTAEDRVLHAIDVDALREADRIRLHRDVDDLEFRVRALENRAGRAG